MLELTRPTQVGDALLLPSGSVTLTQQQRERSRLRVQLDDGRDAGILLARGETLTPGDHLVTGTGEIIEVQAAAEKLSVAVCADPLLHARACYHLGNRHVQLQIDAQRIAYRHDHVLDEMLQQLGLSVTVGLHTFVPESGAYAQRGGHGHPHHDHHSAHEHSH